MKENHKYPINSSDIENAFIKVGKIKPKVLEQIPKDCNRWRIKFGQFRFISPSINCLADKLDEDPLRVKFLCGEPIENDIVCKKCILNPSNHGVVYYI